MAQCSIPSRFHERDRSKREQRLLTLKELEQAGRYFWEGVFSESSKQEITADKAMSIAQFNYRITMELAPKPVIPKGPPLKRERDHPKEKPEGQKHKKGNKKGGGKGKGADLGKGTQNKEWYMVQGQYKLLPFHQFGYYEDGRGKKPNPNSDRAKKKKRS